MKGEASGRGLVIRACDVAKKAAQAEEEEGRCWLSSPHFSYLRVSQGLGPDRGNCHGMLHSLEGAAPLPGPQDTEETQK